MKDLSFQISSKTSIFAVRYICFAWRNSLYRNSSVFFGDSTLTIVDKISPGFGLIFLSTVIWISILWEFGILFICRISPIIRFLLSVDPSNRSTRSSTFCDFPINKRALFISLWVVRILLYSTQYQSKKERIKNRIIHHNFWYLFFRKKERKNPSRRIQRKRHQNIGLKYTQKIPPKKENIDSVRIIFAKVW